MQWAFNMNVTDVTNQSTDWLYKIKHTSDGGYIACGYSNGTSSLYFPSIIKLNAKGELIWQKKYTGSIGGFVNSYGVFYDVIEVRDLKNASGVPIEGGGYVAVGFQRDKTVPVTNEPRHCAIEIVDKDGNELNTGFSDLPFANPNNQTEQAFSVTEAPDGQFLIAGYFNLPNGNAAPHDKDQHGFVYKTTGYSLSPTVLLDLHNNHGNTLKKISIGNVISPNIFDIIIAGSELKSVNYLDGSAGQPTSIQTAGYTNQPAYFTPTINDFIALNDNDVYVARFHYNAGAFNQVWSTSSSGDYSSSTFNGVSGNNTPKSKWPVTVLDYGPYTHGQPQLAQPSSDLLNAYFAYSSDDVATDLIPPTTNHPSSITVLAYANYFAPKNDFWRCADCPPPITCPDPDQNGICPTDIFYDPNKAEPDFDDFRDADGFLLNVDYNTGALLQTASGNYAVNIAHFSGEDFTAGLNEDNCGNYYISGTTTDDVFSLASQNLGLGPAVVPKGDFMLTKTDANFNRLWARNFRANPGAYECSFSSCINEDNSIVMCGNNDLNGDDYNVIKMSSDNQLGFNGWDCATLYTAVQGVSTFPQLSHPYTIRGNLVVPAGAILTISNTTIEFGETKELVDFSTPLSTIHALKCGIVVKAGGKLIIDNSTLRGLESHVLNTSTSCGSRNFMWDGISVEGDPTLPVTSQGVINIKNGSVIQDAKVGILCNKNEYSGFMDPNTDGANDTWNSSHLGNIAENNGGGIILSTSNVTFLNCRKSVEFHPYPISEAYRNFFSNTNFICNAPMVDPDYISNTGERLGINSFCSIWGVNGVTFRGCDFEGYNDYNSTTNPNPNYALRGSGIEAADATFTVTNFSPSVHSKFNNLYKGVTASYTNPSGGVNINDAEFGMDHSGNLRGANFQNIYISGAGVNNAVKNNFISVPFLYHIGNDEPFGIEYNGSTSFNCTDNTLIGFGTSNPHIRNYGVIVSNSGANDNIVYKNTFTNLKRSCVGLFENATPLSGLNGLQFKCNTFNNSGSNHDIDVLSTSLTTSSQGSIRTNQGDNPQLGQPNYYTAPAGNTFYNTCNNFDRIYQDAGAPLSIIYYFNNADLTSHFDPSPSGNTGCISPSVSTINCHVNYNGGDDPCPASTTPCPTCKIAVMQTADYQINSMQALIETGKSDELRNYINNSQHSSQDVAKYLENAGPYLSNEILEAAISRSDSLTNGDLRDIIVSNSPLKESVYQSLFTDKPILAGNADVIMAQLAERSPIDVLLLQIADLQSEKRQAAIQLVDYYLNADTAPLIDSAALTLLAGGYYMDAAGVYASAGNFDMAHTILESSIASSEDELDQKKIMRIYLALQKNQNNWNQISTSDLDYINDLSGRTGIASIQAKNVLDIINGKEGEPEIPDSLDDSQKGDRVLQHKQQFKITNYFTFSNNVQLSVSPNPVNTEANVLYRFAYPATKPMLVVTDLAGKEIAADIINQNENSHIFSTETLQQGVYLIQLMDGTSLLKSIHLVVIK